MIYTIIDHKLMLCAHATFPSDESHESSDESHEEYNKEYIPSLEMPLLSH